jgi:hypothetical protein
MDISPVVDIVQDCAVAGAGLGLAVLIMLIGLKAYRWLAAAGDIGYSAGSPMTPDDDAPFD